MNRMQSLCPAKPLVVIVVACLWVAGLSAVAAQGGKPIDGGTPEATPTADRVVDIRYLRYAPDPIEIVAGESVTWINRDALPHTVTATTGDTPASETLGLGDRYTEIFDVPGTYDYFCAFHAQMRGTLVVREAPNAPATPEANNPHAWLTGFAAGSDRTALTG